MFASVDVTPESEPFTIYHLLFTIYRPKPRAESTSHVRHYYSPTKPTRSQDSAAKKILQHQQSNYFAVLNNWHLADLFGQVLKNLQRLNRQQIGLDG